jgi:hypothetical protein
MHFSQCVVILKKVRFFLAFVIHRESSRCHVNFVYNQLFTKLKHIDVIAVNVLKP